MQLPLTEFPLKEFTCPISRQTHINIYHYDKNCKYKYCKDRRWLWSKGIIE